MRSARASATLGLLALVATASPFATAADYRAYEYGRYGYIGGNVGVSKSHFDEAGIAARVQGPGLVTTSLASDDKDVGYKLYGGYRFNRYFALEGGYFNLGDFEFSTTTAPAGTLHGRIKPRGAFLDAVGIIPITDRFSAFGRAGLTYAKTKDSFSGTGAVVVLNPTPEESDPNGKLGLGIEFHFTPNLGMRAEVERYRISEPVGGRANVDLFSVGLVYRFGARAPAPVQRAPEPVAPRPAPPPPPAAVRPPPPPPQVVTPPPAPPPPAPVEKPIRKDRN